MTKQVPALHQASDVSFGSKADIAGTAQRPLFLLKRTFANAIGMSVKCHKQTSSGVKPGKNAKKRLAVTRAAKLP